jgi:hypothetical protein
MSSGICINNFIEEKFMTKTLKTLIREAKEDTKNLHGTPYLILHTRDKTLSEDDSTFNPSWRQLEIYPNQNPHISGSGSDWDHIHRSHRAMGDLYSRKEMDEEHQRAMYDHTFASYPTNSALWDRHNEPQWSHGLPKNVPILDKALGKFKIPSGGLTTFSGLQSDPSEAAKKHPENKLFLPSYTSSTIKPNVADNFIKPIRIDDTEVSHVMKFKFPEGMNAGTYVGHISHHPSEYEFLTRRGMSVHLEPEPEIIPYRPAGHRGAAKGQLKIWTAHPLSFHEK